MYCPICGAPLEEGIASCQKCGTPIDWSDSPASDTQNTASPEGSGDTGGTAAASHGAAAGLSDDEAASAAPDISMETPSYYKPIDSANPFAPDAGFNGVPYSGAAKKAEETEKDHTYTGSAFVPVGESEGAAGSGGPDFPEEDPEEKRKRIVYWLIIASVAVAAVLVIVLLFRWISGRDIETEETTTPPALESSAAYSFETKETLKPVEGFTVPNYTADAHGYVPPFVYVEATPLPTEPEEEPTEEPSEETTPAETKESSAPEVTTEPSEPDETTAENTDPTEPSESSSTSADGTTAEGSAGTGTGPSGSATASDISPADPTYADIEQYITAQIHSLITISDGDPNTASTRITLPDFADITDFSDNELVNYFMSNVLLSVSGTQDPFATPSITLDTIDAYLKKHVNPAIALSPNSSYSLPPYEYKDGVFTIPPETTPESGSISNAVLPSYLPLNNITELGGVYKVDRMPLSYERTEVNGKEPYSFRLIYDVNGQLIGVAVDEIDAVANTWNGVQNSSNAVYFLTADEMKTELSFIRYTLTRGNAGQFFIASKSTLSPQEPKPEIQQRLNEVRNAFNNGTKIETAPEGGVTVYSKPSESSGAIGTVDAGTEYVTFEFNDPNFKIALVKDSQSSHLGYVKK